MSLRYWLRHFALGNGLIIAVIILLFWSAQKNERSQDGRAAPSQSAQQQAAKKAAAPVDGKEVIEPDWSKPRCDKPQAHPEADLCQQIRMAKAAENTEWLNRWQLFVACIGAILVIATIRYARQAAIAARAAATHADSAAKAAIDSARSDREANRLMQQSADRQLRPWLMLNAALRGSLALEEGAFSRGLQINVLLTIRNVGTGVAKNVRVHAEANNRMNFNTEEFVARIFDERIKVARSDDSGGILLAPSEDEQHVFGTMVFEADLTRTMDVPEKNFIAPFVAVIVTYRAVGGLSDVLYTGKVFDVFHIRDERTFAVDLDLLPLPDSVVVVERSFDYARAN